jgi:alpha-amylase
MNHDTQPGQTVATPIESFFKPLAYSLILLRNSGYPSIFYGDLYGIQGEHSEPPSCGDKLADLVLARHLYAYGDQEDYFEQANCIGWVRRGTWDRPNGVAVVLSNAEANELRMCVGSLHAGETWTDVLGWSDREVVIDDEGFGVFATPSCSLGVYVNREAEGRDKFPVEFDSDIYKQ